MKSARLESITKRTDGKIPPARRWTDEARFETGLFRLKKVEYVPMFGREKVTQESSHWNDVTTSNSCAFYAVVLRMEKAFWEGGEKKR